MRTAGARTTGVLGGLLLAFGGWAAVAPSGAHAQVEGRAAVESIDVPPLRFDPPEPDEHVLEGGVRVLHLRDTSLPLVTVYARFRGGWALFGRERYAAGTALPTLMRTGGTTTLSPDSVDELLEYHAVQTSFGGGGRSVSSSVNTLRPALDEALDIWGDLLRNPGFDSTRVEVWRGQELESVLRRKDDPGRLAVSEFNRLMFGDHPIGWEMAAEDLEPDDLRPGDLRWVHRRIVCPENLILGVWGDVTWDEIGPRLQRLVEGWPPCPDALPPGVAPRIRSGPGVFLIPRDLEQSTVVMAHATGVHQEDSREYFASRIGNAVLGASGFTSRLTSRVRTERGYAYSATSLWTAPPDHDGIVGAMTRTRSETTLAATRLVLEIMEEMTEEAPTEDEVETIVEDFVNGFVFNFESPAQIVARRMLYLAEDLPLDWLARYLEGIQEVGPGDVLRTFREHLRPREMVILVVGDPDAMDGPLSSLGPVTVLDLEGRPLPGGDVDRRDPQREE